jgi:hypothetical protein
MSWIDATIQKREQNAHPHLFAGTDEEIMAWLSSNLRVIKVPAVSVMLQYIANQLSGETSPHSSPTPEMQVAIEDVWGEFYRLVRARMKMPRGGASGGGSMQTLFEIPMVSTETAVEHMFKLWPTKQGEKDPCFELSTMELCSTHLAFHESKWASGWGHGNARPMFISSSKATSLLMAAPPFTVRLRKTTENLNILQVNFAMVLYTESDTVVLPPDVEDSEGRSIPFYLDPPNQPGWHRDAFRAHAKMMLVPLLEKNFPLSGGLSQRAPAQYHQQRAAAKAASEAAAADALGLEIVDAILDVRKGKRKRTEYLVQWTGYQAEWEEQYRQGLGEVGGPFMSWEPESKLKHLTQLADWKAAHPEAEAAQAEAAQTEAAQAQA